MEDNNEDCGDNDNKDESRCSIASFDDDDDDSYYGPDVDAVKNDVYSVADDRRCLCGCKI